MERRELEAKIARLEEELRAAKMQLLEEPVSEEDVAYGRELARTLGPIRSDEGGGQ